MSKTRGRDPSPSDQAHDPVPSGIPLGTYRNGDQCISASYDPERDIVLVVDTASGASTILSRHTWVTTSADPIDRVARQRRALLRAGDLLDQPACGAPDCPCRLAPCECERSKQVAGLDAPRCRHCLPELIDGRPPWVSPADRTVDRSVVATVQDRSY